jgi:signal transduction histidine kinase
MIDASPGLPTAAVPRRRAPTRLLAAGLAVAILTMAVVGVYTLKEIGRLRDEQAALGDRNRKDSLQLLRIQNDLSSLAVLMRDMADRSEPYPLPGWRPAFDRLRSDLAGAVSVERNLAPFGRAPAQQEQLDAALNTYWHTKDGVFDRAQAAQDSAAIHLLRGTALAQQRSLDAIVSQFLVANNRAQEDAARANRGVYDRVARDVLLLVGTLIIVLGTAGAWIIVQNRRAFEEVRELSAQLRTLSWHTMNLQEDLQRSMSRELHDDFGQIVTAIGTLLGRARRHMPADAPVAVELEHVRGIAQQALERIRGQSQWLHPGVLDDFGLEKALEHAIGQFETRTGIRTTLDVTGSIGDIAPDFAIHVYRIVQEALNNIARHASSPRAAVWVRCAGPLLEVDVRDWGTGLPSSPGRGLGIVSMRERAQLLGGRLRIIAAPDGGTTVELRVPDVAHGQRGPEAVSA